MTPLARYAARPTRPVVHNGQRKTAAVVDTLTGKIVDRFILIGAAEKRAMQLNLGWLA